MRLTGSCIRACVLLAIGVLAMAGEADYRLWADSRLKDRLWVVVPHISGPAGKVLRYQIVASKRGHSGRSDTCQSGEVLLGAEGSRTLASLTLGIAPDDVGEVEVKVFEGERQVADLVLRSS